MYVLGIWDGTDSGSALIDNEQIIYASNEEKFTGTLLEPTFPSNSIKAALKYAKIKPSDLNEIAFCSTDTKGNARRISKRLNEKIYNYEIGNYGSPNFEHFKRKIGYISEDAGVSPLCRYLGKKNVYRNLNALGFKDFNLHEVNSQMAESALSAFTSPFSDSLVITMDLNGGSLSGMVSTFKKGKLESQINIKSKDSVGRIYSQASSIIGIHGDPNAKRLMEMSVYSYPYSMNDNVIKGLLDVDGTYMHGRYGPIKEYKLLREIAWKYPPERFSYMVQQEIEYLFSKFAASVIDRYGVKDVAIGGEMASNTKLNYSIANLENIGRLHVSPYPSKGGLALGSAMYLNYKLNGICQYNFTPYLGESYGEDEISNAAKSNRLKPERENPRDQAEHAAELIEEGNYILWFQGRSEYSRFGLGNRSILSSTNNDLSKGRMDKYIKREGLFHNYGASLLSEDAPYLIDYKNGEGRDFMNIAHYVNEDAKQAMHSVMRLDGSVDTQTVSDENQNFEHLLKHLKNLSGYGSVLNTGMNLSLRPIALSPEDAIYTMLVSNSKYLFMDGFTFARKKGIS